MRSMTVKDRQWRLAVNATAWLSSNITAWVRNAACSDAQVQWKGRTTGADVVPGTPWDQSQRFRLVEDLNRGQYFGREVAANVAFVGIVQCDEVADAELCHSICQRYRCADPEPGLEQFWAKYIVDVDGNAWSQRFEQLLLSGARCLPTC